MNTIPLPTQPKAVLFDAYGTLFDVHSIVMRASAGIPGDLAALSQMWRRKQLEYTWLRALMERYEDFGQITEAALRWVLRELSVEAPEPQIEQLLLAYLFPAAFDDVAPALESLRGTPLAILSNGTPAMLEAAVRNNFLEPFFSQIISADQVKTYKPSPLVYALGPKALKIPAGEILFVSCNSWDAAGAKAFGYRVCWCNRSGSGMENLAFSPDFTVRALDEIAARCKEGEKK